mmetsp:Transcript_17359/g.15317  ORF Transcript_17359/g.15317 Transcript_17359/m.15317 type:complete len:123 (-) Transcript_17359:77-445(-)
MTYTENNLRNDVVIKTFSRGVLRELEADKLAFVNSLNLSLDDHHTFERRFQTFHFLLRKQFSSGKLVKLLNCQIFCSVLRKFVTSERIKKIIEENAKMKESKDAYEEAAKIYVDESYRSAYG